MIRKHRRVAVAVAFVLAASFAPPVVKSADAAPIVIERLEASVNSVTILLSDIFKFRQTQALRAQLDPLFAGTTVASKGTNASSSDIVQFLVDERLVSQAFPVGDAEVDQEINQIVANNHIDRASLKNTLAAQGHNFDDYYELIRSSTSKRNLIDREIRTKVTISDDDVKNYFYNHYSKTSSAARNYKVKIITINPRNFKNPSGARDVADRALQTIRAGESFEDVAKRVSDDPSAQQGGDLGTLSEDQMSAQIRDALRKLKVGEVSPVIGSGGTAFIILKLVDIASGEDQRYERMKEEIRGQLVASEYQHQIVLWLERQRQNAFLHLAGESTTPGQVK